MAAVYHNDSVDIELESGSVFRSFLNHTIGSGDNNANWYGVRVFRNGEPVNLTGCSVHGIFMPSSGSAILISDGTHTWVSENEAAVLLPQACYNVKGQFTLAIKIIGTTAYTTTGTVRIVDGVVADTYSENPVAPTAAVPTYQEILAVYDQMVAAKDGSVRFDIEQELTAAQMTQARGNIAAASESDVSDLKSALSFDEYLINDGTYTIKADDLESGQWSYSTKASNTARARTKNLLPVRKGMTISYSNTTYDTYFGVLETPTSPAYIQTPGWKTDGNGTISITQDGWLTFIIRNHADTTANINPADYNSIVTIKSNAWNNVKNIENIVSAHGSSIFPMWRYGAFYANSGLLSSSKNYIASDTKTGVINGINKVVCESGYFFLVYAWDIAGTYIGALQQSGNFAKSETEIALKTTFDTTEYPNYVFSVAMARTPMSADITVAEGNKCHFICTDATLLDTYIPANAKVVGDFVSAGCEDDEPIFYRVFADKTVTGISYAWDRNKGRYHVTGTKEVGYAFYNVYNPFPVTPGDEYYLTFEKESTNVTVSVYGYTSDNTLIPISLIIDELTLITVPENCVTMYARINVTSGTNLDEYANLWITKSYFGRPADFMSVKYQPKYLPSCDLNDRTAENEAWLLADSATYDHLPDFSPYSSGLGYFEVKKFGRFTLQIITSLNATGMVMRRKDATTFTDWKEIKTANTYNNTYTSEHYENTYNITCSPEITTDTNNYLASTDDTTDRTGDIQTMLNTNGICHLGTGIFFVTGITIPTNGMLIGSGNNTILRLADSVTTGYAVKLLTYGCIKDMVIQGAQTSIISSSDNVVPTVGTRHGVLFEGTADAQSNPVTYYRSAVENCMIRWFTGGGITLNNTGTAWSSSLIISDCFIYRCGAGINIPYYSEFSRICNVQVQECYFGCIDNGGNNNFANCDFSANKVGILIDNSTGQSPNNSHGTFSGCTVNHSYSDAGVMNGGTAIKLLGANSGEIFTGLQLFYGGIVIDQCTGIRFIGSNIGRKVPITISNSHVISFSDSTFSQAPDHADSPFTQSGNTTLKFTDCYLHDGTVYNPMS